MSGYPKLIDDLHTERDALRARVERLRLERDGWEARAREMLSCGQTISDGVNTADTVIAALRARVRELEKVAVCLVESLKPFIKLAGTIFEDDRHAAGAVALAAAAEVMKGSA